ncbi:MAG: phosphotransferase [Acidobacteriaceae bacterium]|nr:phosphotransferase [Acidobacteriaceae bacterium]
MTELTPETVQRYLSSLKGQPVRVLNLASLGQDGQADTIKFGGYGSPIRVDYQSADQKNHSLVLHTMRPGPFGHEHMADRAQILLWSNETFGRLSRHVRSLDVGGFHSDGTLISIGQVEEFFLLTEYAVGQGYFRDLEQLRDNGRLRELDLDRVDVLCDYLVEIHSKRSKDAELYIRRVRELVGHGECIMGIADSYPPHSLITSEKLEQMEHRCVVWRWRLKRFTHRLRQVHGDFHPWNILFRSGTDFTVLDRSRGEYGDPADDVACLSLNYAFFSLQRSGRLEGVFETLFLRFWDRYLKKTGDPEMLQVVAPFLAFRALVMASPVWYPSLPEVVRSKLVSFIFGVLDEETFDPAQVNRYFDA